MISIAMTTYNGEKYLCEQLDSILAQTFQDFELIICDDCSSDSTWQILEKYAHDNSKVKIFRNEKNLGFKKNFEKAISLCQGEYIAFSDQDDIWVPEHLSVLLSNIGSYNISGGNAELVDMYGKSLGKKLNEVDGFLFFPDSAKFLWRLLLRSDPIQGASMIMPSSFIKGCLPIPENILYHDAWFAACACMENGINYTFDVVNYYRQHGNNVTFTAHNKDSRSILNRVFSKISIIFKGSDTDRIYYIEELEKRYGCNNEEFYKIKTIINNIEKRRISMNNIIQLWKNYKYISTQNNHKKFIKSLIIWLRWKRINAN